MDWYDTKRPPPPTKMSKDGEVRVRMPQKWVDQLERLAERRGEKKSVLVRKAVYLFLEQVQKKEKTEKESETV